MIVVENDTYPHRNLRLYRPTIQAAEIACARWQRLPLCYKGSPVYAFIGRRCAFDVAVEDVQLGKLIPIPADEEPAYLLAAQVFARLD